jgi:hypothetical protein
VSQSLVATFGFLGGIVAAVADGAAAVVVVAIVVGVALLPAAASVAGLEGLGPTFVAGTTTAVVAAAARRLAAARQATSGLDPRIPIVAPRRQLFGPRSVRVIGAGLALLGASRASLDVGVTGAGRAQGAVFAASFVWLVGVVRLLRARAVEDLVVAAVAVGMAVGVGWLLEVGPAGFPQSLVLASIAPVAGASFGWLSGRHRPTAGQARQ